MKKWPEYEIDETTNPSRKGVVYWCDLDTMTDAGRYQATASSPRSAREAKAVAYSKLVTKVTKALQLWNADQARKGRKI